MYFDLLLFFFYRTDPFAKKDWYDIKAPSIFSVKNVGKTLVTRTQGTKVCVYTFDFMNTSLFFKNNGLLLCFGAGLSKKILLLKSGQCF